MGAVIEDHGGWNDYSEYMGTYKYVRLNRLQLLTFPLIAALSNRNIDKLRRNGRLPGSRVPRRGFSAAADELRKFANR